MTRLLIVDDHAAIRRGLQLMFATVPGIEVVGVAADGRQALSQADQLRPDVVLMDVEMPNVDGVEATRQITTTHPTSQVIILTASDDPSRIEDAMRAGAASYLPKHSDPARVVQAVLDACLAGPDSIVDTAGGPPSPGINAEPGDRSSRRQTAQQFHPTLPPQGGPPPVVQSARTIRRMDASSVNRPG